MDTSVMVVPNAIRSLKTFYCLAAKVHAAIKLMRNRLRPSPCHWRGCDVVLNCADALTQHVVSHALENPENHVRRPV
jgi:hypothetical protein